MLSNSLRRVLCVDDDDDSREMLSALLKLALIEAKTVGTAVQAILSIQAERFDLYLLDTRLPDLDGVELCRQIRDLDPHAPIVFFSGATYEADKKRAIEAGANAYVTKPDIDSLLENITLFVSYVESVTAAQEIPTEPKVDISLLLTYEIAGASGAS